MTNKKRPEEAGRVSEKRTAAIALLDDAVLFLLSLCPILQHYRGLFYNAAVTVLLLLLPYVLIKILNKKGLNSSSLKVVFPLIIFFLYRVIDHGTTVTEAGQAVVFILFMIAIAASCFDTARYINVITGVSVGACLCIIVQYFCYYILDFHLCMVPTSLLLPRAEQWIMLAKTGRYSVTGKLIRFYRPSAFFLEPSHMFIYIFPAATINLLSSENRKKLLISFLLLVGMVLSTSGMGIMAALVLFFLYLGKTPNGKTGFSAKRLLMPTNVLLAVLFLAGCVFAYAKVSFFYNSVIRIFSSGENFSNAVSGRIVSGWSVIKAMRGTQILVGVRDDLSGVSATMSGLFETLFRFGIIGVILSYSFYVRGALQLRKAFFWVAIITIALSFFSQHSHSTMFMINSALVFSEGYKRQMEAAEEADIFS